MEAAPLAGCAHPVTVPSRDRLCIHTMTTKPLGLAATVDAYNKAGVPWITVWRQALEPQGLAESARILKSSGLRVASLCRGGFFPAETIAVRQSAIDDNKRAIDEAAAIGAPLVVLVCGAVPKMPLTKARDQITDGIAALLPHARAAGVRLAIEPLHPMYAADRSAVSTMGQANDILGRLKDDFVGIALDVFHVWWDDHLEAEIRRAGRSILAFHVCDWRAPLVDMLNDRELMGQGTIDIPGIRKMVEATGFSGPIEVEIFSEKYWKMDQHQYIKMICEAYSNHV